MANLTNTPVPLDRLNPQIEVVFAEDAASILRDRYEMPLFFIIGGADDLYLSNLINQPIEPLVNQRSIDPIPAKPYGVYASRHLLSMGGFARTFPLTSFLEEQWPILSDCNEYVANLDEVTPAGNRITMTPTNIQQVWIIRALTRMNSIELANRLRFNLLNRLYPEKLPNSKDLDLPKIYAGLSPEQRKYRLIRIVDDVPIQLEKTLGEALSELLLTGCTSVDLDTLKMSLGLLQISERS